MNKKNIFILSMMIGSSFAQTFASTNQLTNEEKQAIEKVFVCFREDNYHQANRRGAEEFLDFLKMRQSSKKKRTIGSASFADQVTLAVAAYEKNKDAVSDIIKAKLKEIIASPRRTRKSGAVVVVNEPQPIAQAEQNIQAEEIFQESSENPTVNVQNQDQNENQALENNQEPSDAQENQNVSDVQDARENEQQIVDSVEQNQQEEQKESADFVNSQTQISNPEDDATMEEKDDSTVTVKQKQEEFTQIFQQAAQKFFDQLPANTNINGLKLDPAFLMECFFKSNPSVMATPQKESVREMNIEAETSQIQIELQSTEKKTFPASFDESN